MIRVTVWRDEGGRPRWFRVEGHGHNPNGPSIVCAAVSALSQAAALCVGQYAGRACITDAAHGLLDCRVPAAAECGREMAASVETMLVGVRETARQYPEHVTLEERHQRRDQHADDGV